MADRIGLLRRTARARWIGACALGLMVLLAPSPSQAQVAETLLKCQRSLRVAITCLAVDSGLEKLLEISLQELVAFAWKRKDVVSGKPVNASPAQIADLKSNGIEWIKLQEFLVSVFRPGRRIDDAQFRTAVAASCAQNYHPVCPHLGIMRPRQRTADCASIATQSACLATFTCDWKAGACVRAGGLRDLHNQR